MDFLQQQGIRVEVIPGMISPLWNLDNLQCRLVPVMNYLGQTRAGITSASGIAAELGIPLTHRGVATR
jgi:siroheme synthase